MLCLLKKTTSHGFQNPCESSLSEAFKDVILVNTKSAQACSNFSCGVKLTCLGG